MGSNRGISYRRTNADNLDSYSLDPANYDKELEDLESKAGLLKEITMNIKNEVDEQNSMLNKMEDKMTLTQVGLKNVAGKLKNVINYVPKHKFTTFIIITVLFLIFLLWFSS